MSAAQRGLELVVEGRVLDIEDGPTYAEVQRLAQEWSDAVLECRTYQHNWAPQRATWNVEYRYYHIVQICLRCRSERKMDMDNRGHLLSKPAIDYIEGYLATGLGRIVGEARDAIRLAAVTRTFPLDKVSGKKARDQLPRSSAARDALKLDVG